MKYLYETHLHTVYSSACGVSKGSEYIRYYKEMGYTGIIVTDHFYNGNTAVPRNLPWKEWVKQFCRGYEEARNEGERQGLDVFLELYCGKEKYDFLPYFHCNPLSLSNENTMVIRILTFFSLCGIIYLC
jgi:hypothetical protein